MKFFLIGSLEDTGMIKFAEEVLENGHSITSNPLEADRVVIDLDSIKGRLDIIQSREEPKRVYSNWNNYSCRNFFK